MLRSYRLLHLTIAALALAGCSREAVREMGSLKDDHYEATIVRESKTAAGATDEKSAVSKAATAGADAGDVGALGKETIETGSIKTSDECQGEHIAYQATREYLKNFGPKPPDLPGEKGPCRKGE